MNVEVVDAVVDYVKREIFKSGFTGSWVSSEQSSKVLNLGGKKKLVTFNFLAILIFDGEIIKLFFSTFCMVCFYLVAEVLDSVNRRCHYYLQLQNCNQTLFFTSSR